MLDSAPEMPRLDKGEVRLSALERRRQLLAAVVGRFPGGQVLDGTLPARASAAEIQSAIRAWMSHRTVLTLNSAQQSIMTASAASAEIPGPAVQPSESRHRGTVTQ